MEPTFSSIAMEYYSINSFNGPRLTLWCCPGYSGRTRSIRSMAVDALAPCVVTTSTVMLFAVYYKRFTGYHWQWPWNLTNPSINLFHTPQFPIQNRNVHISVLNGALWDMKQVDCGICKLGQLFRRLQMVSLYMIYFLCVVLLLDTVGGNLVEIFGDPGVGCFCECSSHTAWAELVIRKNQQSLDRVMKRAQHV